MNLRPKTEIRKELRGGIILRAIVIITATYAFIMMMPACTRPIPPESSAESRSSVEPGSLEAGNPPSVLSIPEPTPSELASRIRDSYGRATIIEFDVRVSHADLRILCKVRCESTGRHHLEIRTADNKLVYTLEQIPQPNAQMRIREHNLISGNQVEYTEPRERILDTSLGWDPRHTGGAEFGDLGIEGCHFGAYLHSWLGPRAHRPSFWSQIVEGGTLQGTRPFEHSACYVVATGRPQRPGEEIWIECDTGLVRRWRDQSRDRQYDYHLPRSKVATSK